MTSPAAHNPPARPTDRLLHGHKNFTGTDSFTYKAYGSSGAFNHDFVNLTAILAPELQPPKVIRRRNAAYANANRRDFLERVSAPVVQLPVTIIFLVECCVTEAA